ncbi:MAG: diphosphomevalonate decarboxylase [Anaerolineales bacterium]|nr:diphosphomevalonate decarboxylase [Anaerolineales bacterium]
MGQASAQAVASPNIAFIKYWGNSDDARRIPSNASLSMTLGGLQTTTRVTFDSTCTEDTLRIDHQPADRDAGSRVSAHLDLIRSLSQETRFAHVESENNFPAGAGIASSASAFAALTLAATSAAGLDLDTARLSGIARRGSGSAARSLLGGYVQLLAGFQDEDCFAIEVAPPSHWHLIDVIAVTDSQHKKTGSSLGHQIAASSPLQAARVQDAPRRITACCEAILQRDFHALAEIAELDSNLMHAVMLTSRPRLMYWNPTTVAVMDRIHDLREDGLAVFYTVDAGPNVHCICTPGAKTHVKGELRRIPGVRNILTASTGSPPHLC